MRIDRYIEIKTHKRNVGRSCMHCGRPAKITGWRRVGANLADSLVHPIRYCVEHAVEFGAIQREEVTL